MGSIQGFSLRRSDVSCMWCRVFVFRGGVEQIDTPSEHICKGWLYEFGEVGFAHVAR